MSCFGSVCVSEASGKEGEQCEVNPFIDAATFVTLLILDVHFNVISVVVYLFFGTGLNTGT